MRTFVLLTLTVALTGCHQMPACNPQASPLFGQSLLPSCNRTSSGLAGLSQGGTQRLKGHCETKDGKLHVTIQQPAAAQQTFAAQQTIAPMGAYGQQFRVIPGRTHRAMAMGWSAIPLPYPKIEKINVPPTDSGCPAAASGSAGGRGSAWCHANGICRHAGCQSTNDPGSTEQQPAADDAEATQRAAGQPAERSVQRRL